jgi:hypothetical protein
MHALTQSALDSSGLLVEAEARDPESRKVVVGVRVVDSKRPPMDAKGGADAE